MTSAAPTTSVACGIDIGGSGVKSALVDLATGTFIGERVRIDTPEESTPAAVADVCRENIISRVTYKQHLARFYAKFTA